MSVREGLEFETVLESDSAPLNGLAEAILQGCPGMRCMRDPTRGGLSGALNELAAASPVGVELDEAAAGVPIVNVPGCPMQPDNMTETLLYLLYQAAGRAPLIPLDEQLRPTWLFGKTVHEGCDRAGYCEQADFANEYGSPKCLVKIGCWGPVVNCNVTKRGWMGGVGGCPNVGGICIACTMPGFPDKFMPFMDEPPGAVMSSLLVGVYGRVIRNLRALTNDTVDKEPRWRHRGRQLTTGYHPTTCGHN